ncbi:MAG: hypothetical protein WC845_02645 [Candidatus Staskawiczbacteria bacterium]
MIKMFIVEYSKIAKFLLWVLFSLFMVAEVIAILQLDVTLICRVTAIEIVIVLCIYIIRIIVPEQWVAAYNAKRFFRLDEIAPEEELGSPRSVTLEKEGDSDDND